MGLSLKQYYSWQRPPLIGRLFARVHMGTLARRRRWQAIVQQTIRAVLELNDTAPFDPRTVLSAAEIRLQMSKYLPAEEKLSSLIVAMREE